MLKRLLGTAFLIILVFSLSAKKVDQQLAGRVAKNFYYERINQFSDVGYDNISITSVYPEVEQGSVIYYAFSINDQGFVIVSGEDLVLPVIGYSFEGVYGQSPEPVQFKEWMDNIRDQVVYHRSMKSEPTQAIRDEWERLVADSPASLKNMKGTKAITPLLLSTWNQGTYYNELCPEDPDGPAGRVYAGCVATAMAQVMFYYRYPETGNGSHSYNSSYGYLSVNMGATTYKWDEMLTSVQSSNLAVATLLYHCGVSVNMMYSPNGSGAYSHDAADAMKSHFRYAASTHLADKDNYTSTAWANLLKTQLDAKRPLYYHGFGSGGHAFNVDGYQDGDFFHFNWGWSGSYNGYFYLDNLNPGGSDFTQGQGAIVDCYPTENYPVFCQGLRNITGLTGTIEDGSGPSLYPPASDCYFLISPQVAPYDSISRIRLKFNMFDTEADHDVLTIYDGSTTNAPVLAAYSGNTLPAAVTSGGNKILLHFSSDAANNAAGWLLTYESIMPVYCSGIDTYTGLSGTIEDGSGSKHYNNKTVCQYLIKPHNAQKITLSFTSFQTEALKDFVEVYTFDTVNANGNLLGRFSGNQLPPALVSNSGAMFLIFYANASVNGEGWEASYVTQQVGIEEKDTKQSIQVYPNPCRNNFQLSIVREEPSAVLLEILDIRSRLIKRQDLGIISGSMLKTIELSALPAGTYLLRFISTSGVEVRKIMVE